MSEIQIQFPKAHLDKMAEAALAFDARNPGQHQWRFDGHSNFDAAESFFVARQLEFMRPGIYAVQYPALKASRLIPFNMGVDTGAEQYTATMWDQVGEVKVSKQPSDDTPMVGVKVNEASMGIFSLELGYAYTLQEARAAIFARRPLIPTKALVTREQMERKLDDIAFVGESVTGVKGLLNQTGTTTYTPASTGQGGLKTWESKDADAILLDMHSAPAQIVTNTKEIEVPDTMILPVSSFNLIAAKRIGDGTSQTVLTYFQQVNPYIRQIEQTYKAEDAGAGLTKRMTVYRKDPTRLEMIVPQPFEQLPPQARGFQVITLCHMRTAGVALYLPKSVCYADGI